MCGLCSYDLIWYNRNMTEKSADRISADRALDRMRGLIDTLAASGEEFSLHEVAEVTLAGLEESVLLELAKDLILHKGRQHCGGKIRRPDGDEGVVSDANRGRFPRAVPVDRRGTSTFIGWGASDLVQRNEAANRRAAQSRGLRVEADRITAVVDAQISATMERQLAVDPGGDGAVVVYHRENGIVVVDQAWHEGISQNAHGDRDHMAGASRLPERPWEGGNWLTGVAPAGY